MKKLLIAALIIGIGAAFVNDVGRYAKARYDASNIAAESAQAAAGERNNSRNQNAVVAANYASGRGATVYLYDQDSEQVYVWVEMPVLNTWVLGPFTAWQSGEPLDTPHKVQVEDSAFYY